MGIKNVFAKAGGKAADKVAKLSALSPEQVKDIEEKREKYLTEMPSSDDEAAQELTNRLIATIGVEVYNAYLPELHNLYIPVSEDAEYGEPFKSVHNIRYFNVTKWVTDKKENSLEKLVNVYQVLSNEECNIALIFHRTVKGTEVYLGVTNTENVDNNVDVDNYKIRLADAIKGNFPGSEWTNDGVGIIPCLNNDIPYSVACASNIPTEKSEKFVSQTIEKLLDGIVPATKKEEYTIILLATPIQDVEERKLRLAEFYTGLAPYANWSTSFQFHVSDATTSMATFGVNVGASAGVQQGQTNASTQSKGITDSTGSSSTDSTSSSESNAIGETTSSSSSDTTGTTETQGSNSGFSANAGVGFVGGSKSWGESNSTAKNVAKTATETAGKSLTSSTAKTVGKAVATSLGKAVTTTAATTVGAAKSANLGANFGANFARSSTITATVGKNEGITQNFTNYTIKHTLEILEGQMKRLEESKALGMWDFAAYVLSEDQNVANNVTHSYLALTQGEKSYASSSAVNIWRGDMGDNSDDAKEICGYLRNLRHPIFALNPGLVSIFDDINVYPATVTAATSLSGKELAFSLNFPKKSVSGFPVIECAEFGRDVISYDEMVEDSFVELGNIFHMNHQENTSVKLSKHSLSSHIFVTGSTGSGKSNAVYQILDEAHKNNINFLVVEPAKGEYKEVFGSRDDVFVYGTNPSVTPLLRINPFSFPKGVHVLEHIDRLVEIFNVCWPMYAAMPAVLKNAIEQSYIDCGWNLVESTNSFGDSLFPSFTDVTRNIRNIIDKSEYDSENKGAYKGSLLTRLQSLTNGINGLIFGADEICGNDLFNKNVIVDLSRIGSSETKSLIMGMLVLKLQEYRIVSSSEINESIKHITVLEEAHNLLKRTSIGVQTEGGNLLGKSVEMISNAIAEMRTYGEGFIIVDQAPGLLDMAAIRNTNTKIIMRLPDKDDRELVGRAANLNDDQILELAKLPCGVGAVYQNEWVQPILCKVKHFDTNNGKYHYENKKKSEHNNDIDKRVTIANLLSSGTSISNENEMRDLKGELESLGLDAFVRVTIIKMLLNPPKEPRMTKLAPVMNALFPTIKDAVGAAYSESADASEWTKYASDAVAMLNTNDLNDLTRRDIIQSAITYYFLYESDNKEALLEWSQKGNL